MDDLIKIKESKVGSTYSFGDRRQKSANSRFVRKPRAFDENFNSANQPVDSLGNSSS